MDFRFAMAALVLAVSAVAAARPAVAQTETGASTAVRNTNETTYHLHGNVVDGMTNAPVSRALVFSVDRRLATMTDGQGRFHIDVTVPPAAAAAAGSQNPRFTSITGGRGALSSYFGTGLQLFAQKPGYAMPRVPISLSLDGTLDAEAVTLKLMPSASVSGHIAAAETDNARGIPVTLLLHQVQDGEYTWVPAGNQRTDTHGAFHFANLRPGDYCVMTHEWAGDQPLSPQQFKTVTRQYPPDFLGDTPGMAGASVLHVRFGDNPQVQLLLHPVTYYPVSVPVSSAAPNAALQVRVLDSGAMGGFSLGYDLRTGAVEGALPNGSYTLMLSSFGAQQGSALLPITVAGAPLTAAPVTLTAGGSIPVHIHTQFTGTGDTAYATVNVQGQYDGNPEPLPPVQLFLRPEANGSAFANSQHPKGTGPEELLIQNVQPGRYHVQAMPTRGYVASMSSGGVNLMDHDLAVNAGGLADPVEVTLRDDTGTVNGTVSGLSGKWTQGLGVIAVPTDAGGRVTQGFAGADKHFSLRNVAPGRYRVMALRSYQGNIPFRDAEAMRRWDGKGATVTVAAGQTAEVTVPMMDEADEENQ